MAAFVAPDVVAPPPVGWGVGLPGLGGGVNVDFGAGLGLPSGLGVFGSSPLWGGPHTPYVPATPLGSLAGIKGDMLVPIVAIGVALFLLVLIVMAVKYALAWKLSVLEDLSGPKKKFYRDIGDMKAPQFGDDYMMQLAQVVTNAIYSGSCSDRMICEVGTMARGNAGTVKGVLTLVKSYVPSSFQSYIENLESSAEGNFDCSEKYHCGHDSNSINSNKWPRDHHSVASPKVEPCTARPTLEDVLQINKAQNASISSTATPIVKGNKFLRWSV